MTIKGVLSSNRNHLKNIDFSDVDVDLESLESIQKFVLKTDLRLFLNQAETNLKYQEAVGKGLIESIPNDAIGALAVFHQMLDKAAGLSKIKPMESEIKVVVDFGGGSLDVSDDDPEAKPFDV